MKRMYCWSWLTNEVPVIATLERKDAVKCIIGKGIHDKKFHLLYQLDEVWIRVCVKRPVCYPSTIIKGEKVTCKTCLFWHGEATEL